MLRQSLSVLIVLAVLALVGGCGPSDKGVKVTGSVTMASQPQDGVRVIFMPTTSVEGVGPQGGITGADGKFQAKVVPGNYKVILSRMVDKDGKVPGDSEDPSKDFAQLEASGMLQQTMPPQYLVPTSTPLTVEIPAAGKDLEPFVVEK